MKVWANLAECIAGTGPAGENESSRGNDSPASKPVSSRWLRAITPSCWKADSDWMRTLSPAYCLPCCKSRLATPRLRPMLRIFLIATVWPATASLSLSANEPLPSLLGSTHRAQPRSTEEATARANPNARPPVRMAQADVQQQETIDVGEHVPSQISCYVAPALSSLTVNISLPAGKLPQNIADDCAATTPRVGDPRLDSMWAMTEHHWSATGMHHRPLYFEETGAERYGYTPSYTFQPVISAARFFFTISALPYKMVVERPSQCIYTLGHYRPGSSAPRRWHRLPLRVSAGVAEAALIVGLVFLIP